MLPLTTSNLKTPQTFYKHKVHCTISSTISNHPIGLHISKSPNANLAIITSQQINYSYNYQTARRLCNQCM